MFGSVRLDWTFVVLFDLSENWTFLLVFVVPFGDTLSEI